MSGYFVLSLTVWGKNYPFLRNCSYECAEQKSMNAICLSGSLEDRDQEGKKLTRLLLVFNSNTLLLASKSNVRRAVH